MSQLAFHQQGLRSIKQITKRTVGFQAVDEFLVNCFLLLPKKID